VAKKYNDDGMGWMYLFAVLLYPFYWLYEKLGPTLFWLLIGSVLVIIVLAVIKRLKERQQSAWAAPDDADKDQWIRHCERIEEAWRHGDYNWARQQLQQIAYSMVGRSVSQSDKDKFTQVMKDFAREDPLYRQVMEKLLPMVFATPGMVQSQIYKGQPDAIKEQMRYVLYFAHELGHIHRVKKGNSYKLYPPVNLA